MKAALPLLLACLVAGCGGTVGQEPDAGWDPDADIYPPDFWDPGDRT